MKEMKDYVIEMAQDMSAMKVSLKDVREDLGYHIHRTELLEESVEVLKKQSWMAMGGVGLISLAATIIGIIAAIKGL